MTAAFAILIAVAQVSTSVGWAGVPIAEVERAAKRGDKTASFELGERYEHGIGGALCDASQALRWYRKAARDDGGRRLAYSSPVGEERYGRLMPVGADAGSPGLPRAGERLAALEAHRARLGGKLRAPRCLAEGAEQPWRR